MLRLLPALGKALVHLNWVQEKNEVPGTHDPLGALKPGPSIFVLLLPKSQEMWGEGQREFPLLYNLATPNIYFCFKSPAKCRVLYLKMVAFDNFSSWITVHSFGSCLVLGGLCIFGPIGYARGAGSHAS